MEELNKTIDTNLKFFYIIHSKIKSDNHQVPKIVRVPGNKTNPKKRKEKFTNSASNTCNKYRIY